MFIPKQTFDSTDSILSSTVKRTILAAGTLCLDFDEGQVSLRLCRTFRSPDPFEDRLERTLIYPGFRGHIASGYRDETAPISGSTDIDYARNDANLFRPKRGCWVFTSAQYHHELRTAFQCVPIGAVLEFSVMLDHMTNQYCARARLHGDVVQMKATKGKMVRLFQLDQSVIANNTARFGFPY